MTNKYVQKMENLFNKRKTLKTNVHNYKCVQKGLMENIRLYTQPILDEQKKTCEAIDSLAIGDKKKRILSIESTSKKQVEFQDTFDIDFGNIDQNLPKSIIPVFSQDGIQIGKAYIEVDREKRLMRVQGKQNTYAITQELVDLIKEKPLDNYDASHLDDYFGLMNDVPSPVQCKRVKHLSGLVTKTGEGFLFLPDNVHELKARLAKLTSAAKEGHSNVFNEGMAILKRLFEKRMIRLQEFKKLAHIFS